MPSSNASLAANGVAGFFQGMQDKRDRDRQQEQDARDKEMYARQKEMGDLQMTQLKSDLSQKDFTKAATEGLGQYVATNGAAYQAIPDLYNKHFPDGGKMDVQRDPNGQYLVTMTKPDGTVIKGQKPLSFDEFGQIGAALTNPQHYIDAKQKLEAEREKYKMHLQFLKQKGGISETKPAILATADRIMGEYNANGQPIDWPAAYEIAVTQHESSSKVMQDQVDKLMAQNRDKEKGDPGYLSRDEIMKFADENAQKIMDNEVRGISKRFRKRPVDTSGMTTPQVAAPAALFMQGQGNGTGPITSGAPPNTPIGPPAATGITALPTQAAVTPPQAAPAPPSQAAPATQPVAADQPDPATMQRLAAVLKTRQGKPTKLNNGQFWALDDKGMPVRRPDLEGAR